MIEINLLRVPEYRDAVIASQEARSVPNCREIIDRCIAFDAEWRQAKYDLDQANRERNKLSKEMGPLMGKLKKGPDAAIEAQCDAIRARVAEVKAKIEELEKTVTAAKNARDAILGEIGNPIDAECFIAPAGDGKGPREEGLTVVESGECAKFNFENGQPRISHPFVMQRLNCIDLEAGNTTAGARGYYLKDMMSRLNYALISYALDFIRARDPTVEVTQVPFFMTHDLMARCAQLSDFAETLYKIPGDNEDAMDKYLIATSEQPLCAYHYDKRYTASDLPIKHCGISTCFRKEAGRHGVDQLGIFRIHQFEKIEQFRVCAPQESPKHLKEMIETAQAFYESLGLPFRVINIAAHELNNAAAIKYDLEAWFPGSQTYRELVSCSNCTDYQSRRLNIVFDDAKTKEAAAQKFKEAGATPVTYVHMLNSTLCATERTLCCIVENYQTPEGIMIPEVLRPYFYGRLPGCEVGNGFIPYSQELTGKYKEQCAGVVAKIQAGLEN